jgi:hypothetical protein
MSFRSALLASITSIVLMLALGNEWVFEKALDGDFARETRASVTGSLRWQIWEVPSDLRAATGVHLLVLVVLTFVLGGLAGRSGRVAAFFGGWAAFLAASVISLGVYALVLGENFSAYEDVVDRFTASAGFGAPLGMWLGWLVGLAVMIGARAPVATRAAPPVPGAGPGAPPASWPPNAGYDPNPVAAPPPPYNATGPSAAGPPPTAAPAPPPPSPPPPPPPGGPLIGPPPDRTQVYGDPHQQ